MRNYRKLMPMLFGLAALIGWSAAVAAAPNPSLSGPGTARVWFLRPSSSASTAFGAAPQLYVNGAPIGAISADTAFFHDFTPGTYSFTVQSYGFPNKAADTVQLAPGTQTYLEVQYVPAWEEGYAGGGGAESHSFFVLNLSPRLAQAWLPALTDMGQR